MHLPKRKFEALRIKVGWHKRIDQLSPFDIERIVIVYSTMFSFNWKLTYISAYATDLEEYKEWASQNAPRLNLRLVRSRPGSPDGETKGSNPTQMNSGPT